MTNQHEVNIKNLESADAALTEHQATSCVINYLKALQIAQIHISDVIEEQQKFLFKTANDYKKTFSTPALAELQNLADSAMANIHKSLSDNVEPLYKRYEYFNQASDSRL